MNENILSSQPKYSVPDSDPQNSIKSGQPHLTSGLTPNGIKKGFMHYVNLFFSLISPKELTKRVKISTTIHLSILLVAIIGPLIVPHRYKKFAPTVYSVQLINMPGAVSQQTNQVSKPVVTTPPPQKKEIQKPKMETPPKPKTETKKIEKKPIEKPIQQKPKMTVPEKKQAKPEKKEKTPTLEERLEQRLKDTEKKKADTKKDWKETDEIKQDIPNQEEMENIVFSGTLGQSGTLGIGSDSDFPFQWYLANIHSKISSCWSNPQVVVDKNQAAIVSFTIIKTGEIINVRIKKSSGNTTFDDSALKAIELAKPYPQLPIGFKDPQLTINVEFSLENLLPNA
jgi:TonB family protein